MKQLLRKCITNAIYGKDIVNNDQDKYAMLENLFN